jgi:hypothetical protein
MRRGIARAIFTLTAVFLVTGCAAVRKPPPAPPAQRPPAGTPAKPQKTLVELDEERFSPHLLELGQLMTGYFTSTDQAALDTNFADIHLHMVRIRPDRDDGLWLYVEQAAGWSLEKPYRQRIYRVSQPEDSAFISEVFLLPAPALGWAGAYTTPAAFDSVDLDYLSPREGCATWLRRIAPKHYEGGTIGNGCQSALGDAAFATSEVVLTEDRMVSWDRGWTADGEQAWGAETGGYEFRRVQNYPLHPN